MSFSAQTKTELCAIPVSRDCCAVAEAYGLLLFAHTFSHTEIAVVTANEALACAAAAHAGVQRVRPVTGKRSRRARDAENYRRKTIETDFFQARL